MSAVDSGFRRGELWAATLPGVSSEKYYLVVSNNGRNQKLGTALVVRLTSGVHKPLVGSMVEIPHGEALMGRVLCDEIEWMYPEDVRAKIGAFSPLSMRLVATGLKAALGIDDS
jgi:mRNA interferase MazF